MLISTPIDTEYAGVINQMAYSWLRSGKAPENRRRGQTGTRGATMSTEYSCSGQSRMLKRSTVAVQFFADPSIQEWLKFKALVAQWRAERGATSSITAMAMCDPYQKIIGMGREAVPLIIAQMRSEVPEPDQWFWALQVITGVDPVAEEDRGDFVKMSQSWISWAENEGYAW